MYSKHNSKLLYAAQYPIYGVATDGGGRIYLVGGGGQGNFGVPNMIVSAMMAAFLAMMAAFLTMMAVVRLLHA